MSGRPIKRTLRGTPVSLDRDQIFSGDIFKALFK